jgi:hypothetical protein
MSSTQTILEKTHTFEFSESEITQILGSAVKQMVRIADEPQSEADIATLGKVIEKCSRISRKNKR